MAKLILKLTIVLLAFVSCSAFLFDVKTDCQLTAWSSWAELPGLDMHIRERGILRHDRLGGIPCPLEDELRQVRSGT